MNIEKPNVPQWHIERRGDDIALSLSATGHSLVFGCSIDRANSNLHIDDFDNIGDDFARHTEITSLLPILIKIMKIEQLATLTANPFNKGAARILDSMGAERPEGNLRLVRLERLENINQRRKSAGTMKDDA